MSCMSNGTFSKAVFCFVKHIHLMFICTKRRMFTLLYKLFTFKLKELVTVFIIYLINMLASKKNVFACILIMNELHHECMDYYFFSNASIKTTNY